MNQKTCVACGEALRPHCLAWLAQCPSCGLLVSSLPISPSHSDELAAVEERARIRALEELRRDNAKCILSRIRNLRPDFPGNLAVCDIGCGYGWFLDEAARAGLACTGIEPDPRVIPADRKELHIRQGLFPAALEEQEQFDILCFNDVLEHLPDLDSCLAACSRHLKSGGLLSISIPSSEGLFFRINSLLTRIGFTAGYERLWQKGFDYPHLHYFSSKNLPLLLQKHGFRLATDSDLPGLRVSSLWQRLRMSKRHSLPTCCIAYLGILLLYPIAHFTKKDILHQIFVKDDHPSDPSDPSDQSAPR